MTDKEHAIRDVRDKEGYGCVSFTYENNLQIDPTVSDTLIIDRDEWEKMKRWVDENWPAEASA